MVAGQRAVVTQLQRIASKSDVPALNPIMIYGAVGVGKSHLLGVVSRAVGSRQYVFLNGFELKRTLCSEERVALLARIDTAELILLDDVDALVACDDIGGELAAVIERCVMRGARVVGASRSALGSCKAMAPRLNERLGEGVTVILRSADLNERCSLVRFFTGPQELASDVIDWLSSRVTDNLRRLRACALQLASVQLQSHALVDVARARVVLEEAGLLVRDTAPLKEGEVPPPSRRVSGVFVQEDVAMARKTRFKQMLTEAETDDEKRLALEIALGERLRELRIENVTDERRQRFERALGLLRSGNLAEALQYIT
jgi:ABC-type cobalamin/Fe3+-siderophores transport system ATPase subunit